MIGAASKARVIGTIALVSAVVLLTPAPAPAQPMRPAQSVDDLKAQAKKLADQLDRLGTQSSVLDEQYNEARIELTTLDTKVAANQTSVETAKASLSKNQAAAKRYALSAFTNSAADDPIMSASIGDTDTSHRKVFLSVMIGDKQDVIDGLTAARKDLADSQASLDSARAKAERRSRELAKTKAQLEASAAETKRLQSSVSGQLADAVAKQEAQLEAQRAADAQKAADAAAAKELARRPTPRSVAPQVVVAANGQPAQKTAPVIPALPDASSRPVPSNIQKVIDTAMGQLGVPYVWAASSPGVGFDCSGLILYAYASIGVRLPHSSRALRSMTLQISADELQPGDLIFGGNPVHHVGMYIGNGQQINAPHTGDVVKISPVRYVTPTSFGRL